MGGGVVDAERDASLASAKLFLANHPFHRGLNTTGNFYQLWLGKSRGGDFFPVPYKTTTQARVVE